MLDTGYQYMMSVYALRGSAVEEDDVILWSGYCEPAEAGVVRHCPAVEH
jgi:hypothetical protein